MQACTDVLDLPDTRLDARAKTHQVSVERLLADDPPAPRLTPRVQATGYPAAPDPRRWAMLSLPVLLRVASEEVES